MRDGADVFGLSCIRRCVVCVTSEVRFIPILTCRWFAYGKGVKAGRIGDVAPYLRPFASWRRRHPTEQGDLLGRDTYAASVPQVAIEREGLVDRGVGIGRV